MNTEHVISLNTATTLFRVRSIAFALLFLQFFFFIPSHASAGDFAPSTPPPDRMNNAITPGSSHFPVFRIPLRVHLGKSGRRPADFREILDEINDIWLSQAGICFEIQAVADDEPCEQGMKGFAGHQPPPLRSSANRPAIERTFSRDCHSTFL